MSSKNSKQMYYDELEGLKDAFKLTKSQCTKCTNLIRPNGCKIFGKRPEQYANVLSNVHCPEKKEK